MVEAESKEEAIKLGMDEDETDFSYSHTLSEDMDVIELDEEEMKRFNRRVEDENYEDHKDKEEMQL